MRMALMLGSGLFWTVTYVLIIVRGFKDRSYGMPLVALGANLSWEFIFSFQRPGDGAQEVVNIVWFTADLVIAFTVLRFGAREFPGLKRTTFYAMTAGTLVLAYFGVLLVSDEFDHGHATYAAFGQNLMMSALFTGMLISRGNQRGQSVWIGVTKLIGTACASVAIGLFDEGRATKLLIFLYVATFVLDAAYVAALATTRLRKRLATIDTTGMSIQLS